jgi:hypothetical protein
VLITQLLSDFTLTGIKVIENYSVNYGCLNCRKTAKLLQIKKGKGGHTRQSENTLKIVSRLCKQVQLLYCNRVKNA